MEELLDKLDDKDSYGPLQDLLTCHYCNKLVADADLYAGADLPRLVEDDDSGRKSIEAIERGEYQDMSNLIRERLSFKKRLSDKFRCLVCITCQQDYYVESAEMSEVDANTARIVQAVRYRCMYCHRLDRLKCE